MTKKFGRLSFSFARTIVAGNAGQISIFWSIPGGGQLSATRTAEGSIHQLLPDSPIGVRFGANGPEPEHTWGDISRGRKKKK